MSHVTRERGKLVARVRRIGGQVASLERAIQTETECGAILQQVAAVRGAIQGLMAQLLEGQLREHAAMRASASPRASGSGKGDLEPVLAILRSYLR